MADRHSRAERMKLKNVLCDAIRVLCQNTVRYKVQLSVEALIGITVDDGSDFLIVSLNEMIGAGAADGAFSDWNQCQADTAGNFDDSQYDGVQDNDLDMDNGEYWDEEDGDGEGTEEYGNSEDPHLPYRTVIKEEPTSTITFSNATHNRHQQPTVVSHSVKSEPYATGNSEVPYYDEDINHQNFSSHQGWLSHPRQTPVKPRMQASGAQKRTKPATVSRKKAETVGSKVPREISTGRQNRFPVGGTPTENGEDAVSQLTLYTCGTCGAHMQTKTSLLRHKQMHTGRDLCRCLGCGRIIKRLDNLHVHQSRCAAYLSLLERRGGEG